MAKFGIDLWMRARYTIDADTKEEAIAQAMDCWGVSDTRYYLRRTTSEL